MCKLLGSIWRIDMVDSTDGIALLQNVSALDKHQDVRNYHAD